MPLSSALATPVTIRGSSFRFAAVLSSLIAVGMLAGCKGSDASPARRTIIDSRDTYDPRSLDPALDRRPDRPRGLYVFDGLTRFTPDARVEPALAERWTVSPDGLTYTFHLRRGVTFHDGTAFIARQVVHSFERALNPATKGGRAEPLVPIRGAGGSPTAKAESVSGLAAPNDTTVVITLAEPLADVPEAARDAGRVDRPRLDPSRFRPASGRHRAVEFVEWKHDDYLKFARNDKYWGGAPATDTLMARIIPEPSTAVAEFESGQRRHPRHPARRERRRGSRPTRNRRCCRAHRH